MDDTVLVRIVHAVLLAVLAATPSAAAFEEDAGPRIVEIVTDPQADWNGDGRITSSDEFVEIHNPGPAPVDLREWVLVLEDTTPDDTTLDAVLDPGDRLLVMNPPGALNNDGVVRLLDPGGNERDAVAFGSFDPTGTIPDANAADRHDEALAWDGTSWGPRHATPGADNALPYVEVTHALIAGLDSWLAGPNTTSWLDAAIVYAPETVTAVFLEGVPADLDAFDPGRTAMATFRAQVPASGSYDIRLTVATETAGWEIPVGRITVDDAPPATPLLPPASPTNATSTTLRWPAAHDDGVGGVRYNVETLRTTNPNRATHLSDLVDPVVTISNLTHGEGISFRARAIDAFGNASPWSEWSTRQVDHAPPDAPRDLAVAGRRETVVTWSAVEDNGTGVVSYDVRRTWDAATTFFSTNASTWSDPDAPGSGDLDYAIRARDAAGNTGPWTSVVADHEALYPHLSGVRVKKPVWSTGVQEVRIDFDRRMDASSAAQVLIGGLPAEGRWFANASTYYVSLPSPAAVSEGENEILVDAAGPDGRRLLSPSAGSFRVDTLPPDVSFDQGSRLFDVADAQDARPKVVYRAWPHGEKEPSEDSEWEAGTPVGSVDVPGPWTLRYWAVDDAGNQGPRILTSFVISLAGPADAPVPANSPIDVAAQTPLPMAAQGAADDGASVEAVAQRGAEITPRGNVPDWVPWSVGMAGLTGGGAWAVARRRRAPAESPAAPTSLAKRLRLLRS